MKRLVSIVLLAGPLAQAFSLSPASAWPKRGGPRPAAHAAGEGAAPRAAKAPAPPAPPIRLTSYTPVGVLLPGMGAGEGASPSTSRTGRSSRALTPRVAALEEQVRLQAAQIAGLQQVIRQQIAAGNAIMAELRAKGVVK